MLYLHLEFCCLLRFQLAESSATMCNPFISILSLERFERLFFKVGHGLTIYIGTVGYSVKFITPK